jgi:ribose transport system substrate-binding protein
VKGATDVTVKRLLVGALAAVLPIVSLGVSTASAPPAAAASAHRYLIGYDIYYLGNSWSVEMYQEFKQAAAQHANEVQVDYTTSNDNSQTQIANIQDLIAKHVQAIILTPVSPTAVVPVINQAMAAGIKVILLGATINSSNYSTLVNVSDFQFGVVGAKWLAQQLHGKGNIIVLNGLPGISTSIERFDGAESVFKMYPGIHIIGTANAEWAYAPAKTAVANFLAAHNNINGVWSQGGAMTQGAIAAFQAAHRQLVPMTGEDYNGFLKTWIKLLPTGFNSIGPVKPVWLGAKALTAALNLLEGKPQPKQDIFQPPVITNATVRKFVKYNLPDTIYTDTTLPNSLLKKLFG